MFKDKEEIEALQLGSVQMLAPSTAKFAPLGAKEFEALDLPWLFKDDATSDKAMKGPVGKYLFSKLESKGITGLAYNMMIGSSFGLDSLLPGLSATLEWRYFTAVNLPVNTYVNNPGTSSIGTNATLRRTTQPNCCHDNSLLLVDAQGERALPTADKLSLARELVHEIATRLPHASNPSS